MPSDRVMRTFRLPPKVIAALEAKARKLGTSQANAIGILVGAMPESAYESADKRGKLIMR